jgi:hypothetical protein
MRLVADNCVPLFAFGSSSDNVTRLLGVKQLRGDLNHYCAILANASPPAKVPVQHPGRGMSRKEEECLLRDGGVGSEDLQRTTTQTTVLQQRRNPS